MDTTMTAMLHDEDETFRGRVHYNNNNMMMTMFYSFRSSVAQKNVQQ